MRYVSSLEGIPIARFQLSPYANHDSHGLVLPETNTSALNIDGWKMTFPFRDYLFSAANC